jgi:outer membrane protein with beta-barrel domain
MVDQKIRAIVVMARRYKARLLFLMFLLLLTGNGNAQSNYYVEQPQVFSGGIVAGGNFATIDDDDFTSYYKIGANIGGVVMTRFTSHLAGSMELLFSQKGRKTDQLTETGVSGVNFTYIYDRLNYVEVPIMINYVDKRQDYLGVGLSYGRLVSSTEILATDQILNIQPNLYPFNKDDYELLVGGEIHLRKKLYLTLRFQYSFIPIRTAVPTNFSPPEQNNNLWVARLMYLF